MSGKPLCAYVVHYRAEYRAHDEDEAAKIAEHPERAPLSLRTWHPKDEPCAYCFAETHAELEQSERHHSDSWCPMCHGNPDDNLERARAGVALLDFWAGHWREVDDASARTGYERPYDPNTPRRGREHMARARQLGGA